MSKELQSNDSPGHNITQSPRSVNFSFADTVTQCIRNNVADITFYDTNNVIKTIIPDSNNIFPFNFIEKNRQRLREEKIILEKHFKSGQNLPVQQLHEDWIILIILITAFLYSIIRTTSKSMLTGAGKFFLFRGVNDSSSRDIGGLFYWQSTILNLSSFLITALFAYFAASYYNFIPPGISGIFFWFIALGLIITIVSLHHIVCMITGIISGEKAVFMEYLSWCLPFISDSVHCLFLSSSSL